ncbi:TetR/AcrR family transcriptional regulator [Vibrio sp. SCSIO 43137]|uniref:TetR/AcrR family transcriptional regulator n=1 Tax=Vibrio sp. SCSIO 43137 TaxID=3021011 RepID=UPI0023079F3E|nr:TetR/AcrR family transcriptional regulator [Vibrio sp. SCSIO 43137]WCE32244.1 TetR/AcrR family transcriptional regulator [Vibrio sp. SCSIO 43137]
MSEVVKKKQGTKHKSEQERREQILSCSMEVFLNKGYHNTTMKEIVASTGLSKGAIYHYFSCKEEIFNAIFLDFDQKITADFERVSVADDPLTEIKNLLTSTLDEMIRFFRMYYVCLEMSESDALQQQFDQTTEFIRQSVTRSIKEKYDLPTQVDVEDVFSSFNLMMEGLLSLAATKKSFEPKASLQVVFRVIDHLLEVSEQKK